MASADAFSGGTKAGDQMSAMSQEAARTLRVRADEVHDPGGAGRDRVALDGDDESANGHCRGDIGQKHSTEETGHSSHPGPSRPRGRWKRRLCTS
jgi:hypothetical protein